MKSNSETDPSGEGVNPPTDQNFLNYRPKRSFGQGNIFTPVCHSVHRGGVPGPGGGVPGPGGCTWGRGVYLGSGGCTWSGGYLVMGGVPGPEGGVPGPGVVYQVPGGVPGIGGCTWSRGVPGLGGMYLVWGGVPGGCTWSGTPPWTRYPPRAANSGIRSTIGRYASYWNAFLFHAVFGKIWQICMLAPLPTGNPRSAPGH